MPTIYQNGERITGGSGTAAKTPYSNENSELLATNVQDAIDELEENIDDLKKSVGDGKTLVANAITDKGVNTATDATFQTMASNISSITTGVDTSDATASAGVILSGKTAYVNEEKVTGTMANRGAWTGATSGSGNVTIPAGYHNGSGYVSGSGAYNAGKTDYNPTDATLSNAGALTVKNSAGTSRLTKTFTNSYDAGVSATKKGTAAASDVLTGKTFTNSSSVGASGSMANKGDTTLDAGSVTSDSSYTYLGIPANGYYNTSSKLRTPNSNLYGDNLYDYMGIPASQINVYECGNIANNANKSFTLPKTPTRFVLFTFTTYWKTFFENEPINRVLDTDSGGRVNIWSLTKNKIVLNNSYSPIAYGGIISVSGNVVNIKGFTTSSASHWIIYA